MEHLRVISSPLVNWLKLKTCPCSFGIEIAEFSRAEEPLHENVVKTSEEGLSDDFSKQTSK